MILSNISEGALGTKHRELCPHDFTKSCSFPQLLVTTTTTERTMQCQLTTTNTDFPQWVLAET